MSKHQKTIIVVGFGCLLVGFISGSYHSGRGSPFVKKKLVWSIGVFTGKYPSLSIFSYGYQFELVI